MSPLDNGLQEGLTNLFIRCLRHLVTLGLTAEEQLTRNWCIRWDHVSVLEFRRHGAATTQDSDGRAVVYLNPDQQIHQIVWCILHESVHVAQVCRGDLKSLPVTGVRWCGTDYIPIRSGAPGYSDQPWEKEADKTMPLLIDALRKSDPEFGPLLDLLEEHWDSLQNLAQ